VSIPDPQVRAEQVCSRYTFPSSPGGLYFSSFGDCVAYGTRVYQARYNAAAAAALADEPPINVSVPRIYQPPSGPTFQMPTPPPVPQVDPASMMSRPQVWPTPQQRACQQAQIASGVLTQPAPDVTDNRQGDDNARLAAVEVSCLTPRLKVVE
jgi:hypothetical protein